MSLGHRGKAIAIGLLLVGMAALVISYGTFAYFSDTEQSTNVFTAGTIDLTVNGDNPWTHNFNAVLNDLKPGMTADCTAVLANAGQNPMDVWVEITGVSTGPGGAASQPELIEDPGDTINSIDDVIRYGLTVGGVVKIDLVNATGGYTISDDGLHQLGGGTAPIKNRYIYLGNIGQGGSMTVLQRFLMDAQTTNWAQGDTMTFTIKFVAQQSQGSPTPTPPGTELPTLGRP